MGTMKNLDFKIKNMINSLLITNYCCCLSLSSSLDIVNRGVGALGAGSKYCVGM